MATKVRARRSLTAWTARAKSSLPVPVSASKSTGSAVRAKRSALSLASSTAASSPMIAASSGASRVRGTAVEAAAWSVDDERRSGSKCTSSASVRLPVPATGSIVSFHAPERVSKRIPPRPAAVVTSTSNEIPKRRSHVRFPSFGSISALRAAAFTTRAAPLASMSIDGPADRCTSRSIAASAPLRTSPYAIPRSARSSATPAACTARPMAASCLAIGPVTSITATTSPYASRTGVA